QLRFARLDLRRVMRRLSRECRRPSSYARRATDLSECWPPAFNSKTAVARDPRVGSTSIRWVVSLSLTRGRSRVDANPTGVQPLDFDSGVAIDPSGFRPGTIECVGVDVRLLVNATTALCTESASEVCWLAAPTTSAATAGAKPMNVAMT